MQTHLAPQIIHQVVLRQNQFYMFLSPGRQSKNIFSFLFDEEKGLKLLADQDLREQGSTFKSNDDVSSNVMQKIQATSMHTCIETYQVTLSMIKHSIQKMNASTYMHTDIQTYIPTK